MQSRIWTVSEAKARLSEILRLAAEEGPQRIGTRRRYRLVTEEEWQRVAVQRPPMGQWLLDHVGHGEKLPLPDRADPPRPAVFSPEENQ